MSFTNHFITQCPACQTLFKVQAEALAASEGKGRCSTCQHIFNAFEHRHEPVLPEAPAETASEQIETPADESLISEAFNLEMLSFGEPYTEEEPAVTVTPSPPTEELPPEPPLPPVEVPETLFQRRRINWSGIIKPLTAIMLLLLVLLAQTALFFRASLVASYPRSYPILVAACNLLNCSVDLPRRASLITIEDHSLRSDPEHADVLVLEGSIRNSAPYAQAYPLLLLTLTIKPDFPVASRSFTPQEYLPKDADIATGMPAGSMVSAHLNLGVAGIQSTTYQLIAQDVPVPKPAAP